MELLGILLILLIGLLLVAVVGHGLWLGLAGLVRLVTGQPAVEAQPARSRRCALCGEPLQPGFNHCVGCGISLTDPRVRALRDLDATLRQLERFRDDGTLDHVTFERLQRDCQAARQRLVSVPVAPKAETIPVWRRLERLLEDCADPDTWKSVDVQRALAWYRQTDPSQLAGLSATAQRALARLLRRVNDPHGALRAYARLLKSQPQGEDLAEVAAEAAEFAQEANRPQMAQWFSQQALDRTPSPTVRQSAEEPGAPGPEEEILDVLPADPIPTPEVDIPEVLSAEPAPPSSPIPSASPVARPLAPPVEAPAPRPRRSVGEVMAAFMEEKNILWGELVGGLLIVGCSVALVISLWERLEAIPYFPFLIFASITAALFGGGLYTLHHWKLESTSRGQLVIALLLVPLNFVVLAGLSAGRGGDILEIGTEVAALALFAVLVSLAARVIVPGSPWLLTLGLIGPAAGSLLVPRLLTPPEQADFAPFLLLGCVPVGCYLVAGGAALFRAGRAPLQERSARDLLALLGLATFSLAAALGFLVYRAGDLPLALERLAIAVAFTGVPILAGGLLVYRADLSATMRTVGSAVGLAGMGVMLAAILLAWPRPGTLLAVCVLDFAVLTAVALMGRLPLAHVAALPCLAVAYLTGFHLAAGHLELPVPELGPQLLRLAVSPGSGSALIALVVLLAASSGLFVRRGREADALAYSAGTAALALASLVVLALGGFEESSRGALASGVYAAVALALNVHWRRTWLAYGGLALVVLATGWGVHEAGLMAAPVRALVLALESLVLAGLAIVACQTARQDSDTAAGSGIARAVWDAIPARAWRDTTTATAALALGLATVAPGFPVGIPHAATAVVLALTVGTLAWMYRQAPLTWLASALLFGAILHAFRFALPPSTVPLTFAGALLTHATVVLLLAAVIHRISQANPAVEPLRSLLAEPLRQSGLFASALVVPVLPFALGEQKTGASALYAGWLAALWLVVSWIERRSWLFSLGQAALTVAVLLGVTWWLEGREWATDNPAGLCDPRSLQTYGIALAALSLVWTSLRAALRSIDSIRQLLEPPWPTVDRVVLAAVVIGQLTLAVAAALPGTFAELTSAGNLPLDWLATLARTHGPGAWGLLLAATLALIALLWQRSGAAALGLLLATVTVPVLVAGNFADERATASALRWGLASCFLVASAPLWLRGRLGALATALRIPASAEPVSMWGRWLLVALTVGPVLLLTAIVALVGFSGSATPGPDVGSFFGRIGWVASNVLPLVLVSAGLVCYAVRDRLPGYAFAASLVADTSLMGGYALHVLLGGGKFDDSTGVRVVQLGALGIGLWAVVWLFGRRVLSAWRSRAQEGDAWRSGEDAPIARQLLALQIGLGAIGNAVLLLVALGWLTLTLPVAVVGIGPHYPAIAPWTGEAGTVLGWLALAVTAASVGLAIRRPAAVDLTPWLDGASLVPHARGLSGLAAVGLMACSVERLAPGWGYRALMLGWAASAVVWVAVLAARARLGREVTLRLSDAAAVWVTAGGVLALLLGLKAAFGHSDPLWAAVAVGAASTAGAGLAVQRRQEGWAFVAGLGVNLAASLVVWHFNQAIAFASWGVALLQANAVASASAALLWLWWRRQVYGAPELRVVVVPLLGVQVAVGLALNALLTLLPLAALVFDPSSPLSPALALVGGVGGWAALALTAEAALVYVGRSAPRGRLPVATLTALAACVLAACSAARWDTGNWLSFHVLLFGWGLTCLALPVAGIVAAVARRDEPEPSGVAAILSARTVGPWVIGAGLAVVVLALRGAWGDPQQPYWSGAATLSVVLSTAALALWTRRSSYVYFSSVLVNLVGFLTWLAWGTDTPSTLYSSQVLCLAVTAGLWSAVESRLCRTTPAVHLRGQLPPFSLIALIVGLMLLAILVAAQLTESLNGEPASGIPLTWVALVALVIALVVDLWDDRSALNPAGLYAVGLIAIGLGLAGLQASPARVALDACLLLAGFVLLTAVITRVVPQLSGLRRALSLPDPVQRVWSHLWFLPAQAAVASLTLALSVGVSVGFDNPFDRFAGPLAVALFGAAALVLVRHGPAAPARYVALILGVALLTELGWAAQGLAVPAVAMHRSVLLMAALAVTTVGYGVGLARGAARWPAWAECGRRCAPVLGLLALAVLLGVLGQEFVLFDPTEGVRRTPMLGWAVALVAAALVGLTAAQVRFAVLPGRDPFGLSEKRRTMYVYAAEALVLGLFLHVRLNLPWLFGKNFGGYWPLVVMGAAYLSVGLAEIFQRQNLPVLSGPMRRTGLLLPLLPLLAFWVRPPEALETLLRSGAPGTGPMLDALKKLPTYHHAGNFDRYALLWILLGGLYTIVALTRRSSRYALFAALAANVGLWCLLYYSDWQFFAHPQMWLVPLALIVLVAEYLNRERLGPAPSAALRYAGLGLLYLSSTADMFIAGLGHSVVLPLVLAVLSVCGVMAGIVLRVRAFLLLGVSFLGLVVFSMIWHAAVDLAQTWVWWASGIALGLAILGLFALFEKRRNDVLRIAEAIKKWD